MPKNPLPRSAVQPRRRSKPSLLNTHIHTSHTHSHQALPPRHTLPKFTFIVFTFFIKGLNTHLEKYGPQPGGGIFTSRLSLIFLVDTQISHKIVAGWGQGGRVGGVFTFTTTSLICLHTQTHLIKSHYRISVRRILYKSREGGSSKWINEVSFSTNKKTTLFQSHIWDHV